MSLTNKKDLGANKWEIEITVSAADFTDAVKKAYKQNIKKINVPGFRKGKAPLGIVETMYGESVFFDDAIDLVLPSEYENAIEESTLIPVGRPEIEVIETDRKEKGLVVKAIIYTKPEVKVSKYKGIKADKVVHTVTDEEVNEAIDKVRERNSKTVTVEGRKAKLNDVAIIDFEGFVGDVAFDGGKGNNFSLTLGSGQFIPGFEDQIVGKKAGESFDVNVTFPAEYQSSDLAGKDSVFKVTLHELKATELPELDNEFVKDVSEFDTVEEYKNMVKTELEKSSVDAADAQLENVLIDSIIENMEAEIPQIMFDNKVDEEVKGFANRLQGQGMDIDTYLQYTGMTMDAMKETFKEQAEKQVKIRLALEEIVKAEKIEVTEAELEEQYKEIAEGYKISVDEVKKYVPTEELELDTAVGKAVDFVKENAKITVVEETVEKAPAKKAPAKKAPAKKAAATTTKKPAAKKAPAKKATTEEK